LQADTQTTVTMLCLARLLYQKKIKTKQKTLKNVKSDKNKKT